MTNLEAVDLVLRADGDIPIDHVTRNQCDHMGEQNGSQMFYIALNEPYGTVEAYVVVDRKGNFSYYDFTDEDVVINGEHFISDPVRDSWKDELEDLIMKYRLESGEVAEGGIEAYMELLKHARD